MSDTDVLRPRFFPRVRLSFPKLGQFGQFARQSGARFGRLRIDKNRIVVNDGTVDAVILDSVGFHIFDTGGNETLRLSSDGLSAYGTTQTVFQFRTSATGTYYGAMGLVSGSAFSISNAGPYDFELYATGTQDFSLLATKDAGFYAYNDVIIRSDSDSSGDGEVYIYGRSTGTATDSGFFVYDFGLSAYVEKSVIMPTSKGFKALYCMESPELWFMDFCPGWLKRHWPRFWVKEWVLHPDQLFLEVTEKPYIIMPTSREGLVQLWGKRRGKANKRFEDKTKEEFNANENFWTKAKV